MSYCINPACPQPQNPNSVNRCQACGSELILRDRYQIIQPLGKGGFGATFLSKDTSLPGSPICVIKELRPSTTTPSVLEMSRKLFEREAETLGKIGHHPQVPRLLGYFEWKKHFYLVQEYVSGSTLKQEVKKQGILDQEQVKQFLIEILPVISYIHSQEVIHRDIKPANIIRRSQDGHLVLIDFGAVKDHVNQTHLASGGTGETAFTNISIGTSGFAPPEQMALRPVYASDIYALGVTCIFLLTGKTPNGLGYDQINGEILWRPLVNISDWFGKILEKMLEVSVRHRFQSAEELLTALKTKEPEKKQVEPTSNSLNTAFREEPKEPTVFHEHENDLSWMSPNTQVAQKIRERKTRIEKKPATRSLPQMKMRKEVTKGYLTTVSPKKTTAELNSKTPEKWTAATLRSAYVKGRRDFADCNLSRLNLRNAKLSGVNFYGANLHQSDLQGADLSDANLGHVNLTNTVLKNTNLTKAYLSTASLAGCDLRDADLTNAYLSGANLRGANLCGTNLTNAMVNDRQLDMAKTNWRTIMPNGKRGSGL
ncbi:serine/threonine-protein kinase [Okeania sp. KiyG1]|uniref:serine/threonine-protein kinase n=1 Tax=Okeania sp. KiyG1 TaxID=2720165 RepID=UPI001921DCD3|nr:serine/threonine-protein kinase [Okeania sp. KiyG1]GFZ98769.1 serine/threonine protein kinase [Okeania sp. KiyG1]